MMELDTNPRTVMSEEESACIYCGISIPSGKKVCVNCIEKSLRKKKGHPHSLFSFVVVLFSVLVLASV